MQQKVEDPNFPVPWILQGVDGTFLFLWNPKKTTKVEEDILWNYSSGWYNSTKSNTSINPMWHNNITTAVLPKHWPPSAVPFVLQENEYTKNGVSLSCHMVPMKVPRHYP